MISVGPERVPVGPGKVPVSQGKVPVGTGTKLFRKNMETLIKSWCRKPFSFYNIEI